MSMAEMHSTWIKTSANVRERNDYLIELNITLYILFMYMNYIDKIVMSNVFVRQF